MGENIPEHTTVLLKKCIDRYCDENFPRRAAELRQTKKEEIPVYEKLYDLPETPLSLSHAAEIELDSWETTRRLTEAFSENTLEDSENLPPQVPEKPREAPITEASSIDEETEKTSLSAIFGDLCPFAEAAYREDFIAQRAFCTERGMLSDMVADRVNELASDALGDILLFDSGDGYTVIDEYRSLFEAEGM